MGDPYEEEISAIAREIDEYLSNHPRSADTLEGIVTWWLERWVFVGVHKKVQGALELLCAEGKVEVVRRSDGVMIFFRKSP